MKFSDKIKELRSSKGVTQANMAGTLGVSIRTITNYENGKSYPKDRKKIDQLAQYFDVSSNYILTEDEEFIMDAINQYVTRGTKQAHNLLDDIGSIFANGNITENKKDELIEALQKAYFTATKTNKHIDILSVRNKLDITRKEFSDALRFNLEQEKNLKDWESGKKEIPEDVYNGIMNFQTEAPFKNKDVSKCRFKQIDLFAGIGGIRLGFQKNGGHTVFSSEWDKFAQKSYNINYGEIPHGDIAQIDAKTIPDHDILLAGFPCQPFSQAGLKKGFEDARGTLFFNIATILEQKQPKAFMLENVKQLKGHDKGNTLLVIRNILNELNYYVPEPEVLNAYHFGTPQNRERIIIVGFNKKYLPNNFDKFTYPKGEIDETICVGNILEKNVIDKFTISDRLYSGHLERKKAHAKKGNGFGFSLFDEKSKYTSTISARYYKDGSEALIKQKDKNPRMLTPRECARLQGFPEDFIIGVSNSQAYKQFGNSVCINVIDKIAKAMLDYLGKYNIL